MRTHTAQVVWTYCDDALPADGKEYNVAVRQDYDPEMEHLYIDQYLRAGGKWHYFNWQDGGWEECKYCGTVYAWCPILSPPPYER